MEWISGYFNLLTSEEVAAQLYVFGILGAAVLVLSVLLYIGEGSVDCMVFFIFSYFLGAAAFTAIGMFMNETAKIQQEWLFSALVLAFSGTILSFTSYALLVVRCRKERLPRKEPKI